MRAVFWFLALFGVAVAVALFVGNNQGTVTFFWPPYRLDLRLNMLLLILIGGFLISHSTLKALSALFDLPNRAKRWRLQQKERVMHNTLLDALTHLAAGRFVRGRKAALAALNHEQHLYEDLTKNQLKKNQHQNAHYLEADQNANVKRSWFGRKKPVSNARQNASLQIRSIANLVAADCAHALQNRKERDAHLQEVLQATQTRKNSQSVELNDGASLRVARWLVDDRDAPAALEQLEHLPQGVARRTLALRIRLKAARLSKQHKLALETARLLTKHRAFSPRVAPSIVRGVVSEWIQSCSDLAQLQSLWSSLDKNERQMPDLIFQIAKHWCDLGGDGNQARQWLKPIWESFVKNNAFLSEYQQMQLVHVMHSSFARRRKRFDDLNHLNRLNDSSYLNNLDMDQKENKNQADNPIYFDHQTQFNLDSDWLGQIEEAYQQTPNNVYLQYLAGMACKQRQLWGKAQQLLSTAVPRLQTSHLQRHAWCALAELASQRGDLDEAALAWKKAALIDQI